MVLENECPPLNRCGATVGTINARATNTEHLAPHPFGTQSERIIGHHQAAGPLGHRHKGDGTRGSATYCGSTRR